MWNYCRVNKNHQFFFCSVHLFKKEVIFQLFLFLPRGEISTINFNWHIVIQEDFCCFIFFQIVSPLTFCFPISHSFSFFLSLSLYVHGMEAHVLTHTCRPTQTHKFSVFHFFVMSVVIVWELGPSYGPEYGLI